MNWYQGVEERGENLSPGVPDLSASTLMGGAKFECKDFEGDISAAPLEKCVPGGLRHQGGGAKI